MPPATSSPASSRTIRITRPGNVRQLARRAAALLWRDDREPQLPGHTVRGRARHAIHRRYSIEAPPTVAVRPYMSERPAAAFVARDFELQILSGDIANVPMAGARVLARKTDVVDGKAMRLAITRHPIANDDGWTLELVADIGTDDAEDRLHASATCADEQACAVAERMLMSIEFARVK